MTATERPVKARRPRATAPDRRALLAAAAELLAEHGYQETSMSDIAARAGMSVGSVYNLASGKSALLIDVYREYDERQSQRVSDAIAAARGGGIDDPVGLFLAGSHAYLTGVWRERHLSAVLTSLDSRDVDLDTLREVQNSWMHRNARILGLDDGSARSEALSAAITGAMGGWVRGVQQCDLEQTAFDYITAAIGLLRDILHATAR